MKKRSARKSLKSLRRKMRHKTIKYKGGGWTDGPEYIKLAPGNLVHTPYSGPGKDCTGNPESIRPGHIDIISHKGLPGLSGGGKKLKKIRGGELVVANPSGAPTFNSITGKPDWFPDTQGVGGTVSAPGVPPMAAQAGGRYGFFPSMGPLNPTNGVGVTPAPFGRIPCETGTYNSLNPNPGGVQTMSTAPLVPPYVTMKGGAGFPVVNVGNADSMRYYAPTAGYRNDFMTFSSPSPVPGLTIQTPYDAKSFNQACIKTGGGNALAQDSSEVTPLTIDQINTRKDFDGTNGLLPVKFGGKRRTHKRKANKKKRSGKASKATRKATRPMHKNKKTLMRKSKKD